MPRNHAQYPLKIGPCIHCQDTCTRPVRKDPEWYSTKPDLRDRVTHHHLRIHSDDHCYFDFPLYTISTNVPNYKNMLSQLGCDPEENDVRPEVHLPFGWKFIQVLLKFFTKGGRELDLAPLYTHSRGRGNEFLTLTKLYELGIKFFARTFCNYILNIYHKTTRALYEAVPEDAAQEILECLKYSFLMDPLPTDMEQLYEETTRKGMKSQFFILILFAPHPLGKAVVEMLPRSIAEYLFIYSYEVWRFWHEKWFSTNPPCEHIQTILLRISNDYFYSLPRADVIRSTAAQQTAELRRRILAVIDFVAQFSGACSCTDPKWLVHFLNFNENSAKEHLGELSLPEQLPDAISSNESEEDSDIDEPEEINFNELRPLQESDFDSPELSSPEYSDTDAFENSDLDESEKSNHEEAEEMEVDEEILYQPIKDEHCPTREEKYHNPRKPPPHEGKLKLHLQRSVQFRIQKKTIIVDWPNLRQNPFPNPTFFQELFPMIDAFQEGVLGLKATHQMDLSGDMLEAYTAWITARRIYLPSQNDSPQIGDLPHLVMAYQVAIALEQPAFQNEVLRCIPPAICEDGILFPDWDKNKAWTLIAILNYLEEMTLVIQGGNAFRDILLLTIGPNASDEVWDDIAMGLHDPTLYSIVELLVEAWEELSEKQRDSKTANYNLCPLWKLALYTPAANLGLISHTTKAEKVIMINVLRDVLHQYLNLDVYSTLEETLDAHLEEEIEEGDV